MKNTPNRKEALGKSEATNSSKTSFDGQVSMMTMPSGVRMHAANCIASGGISAIIASYRAARSSGSPRYVHREQCTLHQGRAVAAGAPASDAHGTPAGRRHAIAGLRPARGEGAARARLVGRLDHGLTLRRPSPQLSPAGHPHRQDRVGRLRRGSSRRADLVRARRRRRRVQHRRRHGQGSGARPRRPGVARGRRRRAAVLVREGRRHGHAARRPRRGASVRHDDRRPLHGCRPRRGVRSTQWCAGGAARPPPPDEGHRCVRRRRLRTLLVRRSAARMVRTRRSEYRRDRRIRALRQRTARAALHRDRLRRHPRRPGSPRPRPGEGPARRTHRRRRLTAPPASIGRARGRASGPVGSGRLLRRWWRDDARTLRGAHHVRHAGGGRHHR